MPERVKKTKCGGGVAKKNLGGGNAGEGKEDEMRGGGGWANNLKVGVCRRGYRRQNAGGGGLRKKIDGGGGCRRGKEDKMRGWGFVLGEKFEGVCRRG